HAVCLFDEITATAGPGLSLMVTGEGADLVPTDSTNLAWRAAGTLAAHAGIEPDVALHLMKRIPVAGGMAGGSADAAGTLLACDALWQLGTPRTELLELAAGLGSDVPFALQGGTAIGTGRGERLTPVLGKGAFHWVFALADGGLSTPAVYAECDRLRAGRTVPSPYVSDMLMQALRAGDAVLVGKSLHNDLQPAALSLRPSLARVLEFGEDFGALGGLVCGSGPTCAFIVRDADQATGLAVALSASGLARTVTIATSPAPGARIVP
ncbi:MAG: 4-(cytidine 5'-diphospho)-2-C-methyl-D-erythritol kinase, partial [Actinomycetales bacterium]